MNNSNVATNMVSTQDKKYQHNRLPIKLNDTLTDFVFGNKAKTGVAENNIIGTQTSGSGL